MILWYVINEFESQPSFFRLVVSTRMCNLPPVKRKTEIHGYFYTRLLGLVGYNQIANDLLEFEFP